MTVATLLLWLLPAYALSVEAIEDTLAAAVAASRLPPKSLSLLAVEEIGDNPSPLLAVNHRTALIPASVTKLATAAAVLWEIPLGTRFETRLLSTATVNQGTLEGDLILQGGGDPSLVSETLWLLVNHLAQAGVRRIAGDIVTDAGYFDDVLIDPGRRTKRSEMAYDAPVSALSFNWNAAALRIEPGARVGELGKVAVEPASNYLHIDNQTRTTPGDSIAGLVAYRLPHPDGQGDLLTARGPIGINASAVDTYRNVTDPPRWTAANLALYLEYRGIAFNGNIRQGNTPPGAHPLAVVAGRPVEQLVADMNKVSSNFVAEMLTKHMAARRAVPGSMAVGLKVIEGYLSSLGLDQSEYQLTSPSGLSRGNRLSAHALVQVLATVSGDFRIENEFMASLPIAGIDGTLRKRMTQTTTRGWVRAKTGYLEGAVSLAGYVGRKDGSRVIFAFIYNGDAPTYRVKALFDQLSATLASH